MKTKSEYKALVKKIKEHNRHYYEDSSPKISDLEYDRLFQELVEIESEHPEWVEKNSPTLNVGSDLKKGSGFKKSVHKEPMLSLSNTYSFDEISLFIARVEKGLRKPFQFSVELKMDGVALSIYYENGKYKRAVTRGDGYKGDDVTENIRTIKTLPKVLEGVPGIFEVRGEVFMPTVVFNQLNNERENRGEELYANARNTASGTVKLHDPNEVKKRKLAIKVFGIGYVSEPIAETQMDVHSYLKKKGFPAFEKNEVRRCKDVQEIIEFSKEVEKLRKKLSFEIDGMVIKLDQLSDRDLLGYTGKSPKWATAYKFAPEQVETVIDSITLQVGRTGVITPVAELKPVRLAGSVIRRATLHNGDEIERKDIRVSDYVMISKGGDVIPKVESVIKEKRKKRALKFKMPEVCPSCGSHLKERKGSVGIFCENKNCSEKIRRKIAFFASKPGMNIEHLGPGIVIRLIKEGLVGSISDIYRLDRSKLKGLDGFKEKAIDRLLTSIERSKSTTLSRLIYSLGIPFIGASAAKMLERELGSIKALIGMSKEKLLELEGIGEEGADSLVTYFKDRSHLDQLSELETLGVRPEVRKIRKDHPFLGKTFVITGTLENLKRDEARDLIENLGGIVSSSVTRKTDFLLAGEKAGSKLAKAEKLNITILKEKDLEEKI